MHCGFKGYVLRGRTKAGCGRTKPADTINPHHNNNNKFRKRSRPWILWLLIKSKYWHVLVLRRWKGGGGVGWETGSPEIEPLLGDSSHPSWWSTPSGDLTKMYCNHLTEAKIKNQSNFLVFPIEPNTSAFCGEKIAPLPRGPFHSWRIVVIGFLIFV